MPVAFWNFPLMTNISEPKELLIIPEADHVSLYDDMEKIPFDKLNQFFKENLK